MCMVSFMTSSRQFFEENHLVIQKKNHRKKTFLEKIDSFRFNIFSSFMEGIGDMDVIKCQLFKYPFLCASCSEKYICN